MANSSDISFLDQLNAVQREAVTDIAGPSLIVAGAGSGKTRVLTYKIAYLLSEGVRPWNILALTFTNKAAREMRTRIAKLVGEEKARQLHMGTFHSVFAKILRREAAALGYSHDYTIYDTQDSKSLLKAIGKELHLDDKLYKPAAMLSRISLAKNRLITPELYATDTDLQQQDKAARMYRMPEIYNAYQQRLRAADAMDFDDLLVNTFLLLHQNEEVRTRYRQGFKYLLVDEYQDTNHVQYMIIRMLAEPDLNISVVGDDAQSIYSFRGANIENILRFQKDFPHSHLYKLEQNYRSTKCIVGAANSLIDKNQGQIHKNLFSDGDKGERLSISSYGNDRQEAAAVAADIHKESKRHHSLNQIAVLYRTNAQSRLLEDELRKSGLPYRIYGGVAFYQRKEVKDMLAYLRLCCNLKDEEALLRIINLPARGIGDTTMKRVTDLAHQLHRPAFDIVASPDTYGLNATSAARKRLIDFAQMVLRWRERLPELNAIEFTDMVMRESQLMTAAIMDQTQEGRDRYDNMTELQNGIREFVEREQQEGTGAVSLSDFLSEVSLMTDQDQNLDDKQERVTLMTVHSAKGLEFEVVYVVGMEEYLFPSPFAQSMRELEEERRLFYVAITRAKQICKISYCQSRYINGKQQFQTESRFLRDISPEFVQRAEKQTSTSFFYPENEWDEFEMPAFNRHASSVSNRHASPVSNRHASSVSNPPEATASRRLTAISTEPNAQKQDIDTQFKAGFFVRHNTFGRGEVISTYSENGNDKIDILFDTLGKKTLLLKFARLTKADS